MNKKVLIFSLAVIALAFILLALPGQFAHYGVMEKSWIYKLSGYQFFFNTVYHKGLSTKLGANAVGQGIAIIVLLALAIPGIIFSNKSSFVCLVTGVEMLVTSILYFTISGAGQKAYTAFQKIEGRSFMNWVPYVSGALILIAAGLLIYKAIMMMKDEVKRPAKVNKGPSYNYLHK